MNEVGTEIRWRSKQGQRTGDNWDYCGIGLRSGAILCIILDGSTAGPSGGEFARLIACDLIDWFLKAEKRATADILVKQLRHIHTERSPEFRSDSASYLIVLIEDPKRILVLHAGDCLAGRYDGKTAVNWLTRPHTLANAIMNIQVAEIAGSPLRNRLTRSFRARDFINPDVFDMGSRSDGELVVGTDGFWAELDTIGQVRFLEGDDLPLKNDQDDCSALRIRFFDSTNGTQVIGEQLENLYIAHSE